jgi:hypothetical protein
MCIHFDQHVLELRMHSGAGLDVVVLGLLSPQLGVKYNET